MNTPKIRNSMYRLLYQIDNFSGRSTGIFILCYHGIGNDSWRYGIELTMLKKQIIFLKKKGYTFITLSDLQRFLFNETTLPEKSVLITIDDGYKEVLQTVEFFKQHKISPAMFLLSDTKHANRKELANDKKFLDSVDIAKLRKYGWEFGSHSSTHSNLATLTKSELTKEIVESKKMLEKQTKHTISSIAYPRGKYNQTVLQLTKKAGYTLGLSMEDGIITRQTDKLLIPRIGIDRSHTMKEFPMLFSPSVIQFRKRIKQSFLGRYL